MTVNIDNAVFAEYKRAAQLIRDGLVKTGDEVPLNQLIDLLINAELSRIAPEAIARHFLVMTRMQASNTPESAFLHEGETGQIPRAGAGAGSKISARTPDEIVMPQTGTKAAPTKEHNNAQPRTNAEIDRKIDRFITENPSFVENLKALPREVLERKIVLARIREMEAQQQYSRKVLSWLDKPENAELKETLLSTLPPAAKPEKQEQLLASQAKMVIKNRGIKI